jgi:hypothetical protein
MLVLELNVPQDGFISVTRHCIFYSIQSIQWHRYHHCRSWSIISEFVQKILLKMSSSSSSCPTHIVYGSSFVCDHQNCNHYIDIVYFTSYTVYNKWYIDRVPVEVGQTKIFLKYHHHHHPCIPSKIGSFDTYRI